MVLSSGTLHYVWIILGIALIVFVDETYAVEPLTPPSALWTEVISATTISLKWKDGALGASQRNTDGRYYTIRYKTIPKGGMPHKYLNTTELNALIDGLTPDTRYKLKVKVTRGQRSSTWSKSLTRKTSEAEPTVPGILEELVVQPTSNSLAVQWVPNRKWKGHVDGYIIGYGMGIPDVYRHRISDANNHSFTIEDLDPGTEYIVAVRAYNELGEGRPTYATVSTLKDTEMVDRNITEWSYQDIPNRNTTEWSYQDMAYRTTTEEPFQASEKIANSTFPWESFQATTQSTNTENATYPRNITATFDGYAITVTWDSPHAELPPTAFYNVYFTSDAQSAEMRLPSSATNAKYYPTSWSVYRIQISTTVGNEEGEMSPAVVVNTRDYLYATYPRNIKATVAGRVATLTWDSPLIGLPPTAFYKVYYKSELQWGEYRVPSTATNFDLFLLPGTTYQIRMSTAVADDESLKSPAIAVKARDLDATYPRNITATFDGYAITVTWDSPHAELPPTAFYNVYFTTDVFFTTDVQSTDFRFPSTTTNAKYYPTSWEVYRIQISTTVGNEEGEMSPAVVVNTRDYLFATYPRNIKATVAGRVATVTWDSPSIDPRPTAVYKVDYKSELHWGNFQLPPTATNFDLDLLPGTTYQIRMSIAVAGDAIWKSPAIAVKARDLEIAHSTFPWEATTQSTNTENATYPRNITATVEGYAITVTWDSPHAELPPTAFYNVYFTSDAQSAEMRLPISATNAKYYPTSWSVYRIQISTTVGNEEGEMSPAVVVNTRDHFYATYPRNIKATVAGRVATLTWDSPLIGLPPTAFYKVYYKSALQAGEYHLPSTATNFDLDLLPGTTYQIRMSTAVADDESLKSQAIAVKARDLEEANDKTTEDPRDSQATTLPTNIERTSYACEDRGVAGYRCDDLDKTFGSTKKMCKRAFHECCDTCSRQKFCKRDRHVAISGKVHDCSSLVQKYGKATACTIFTKECCVTCSEEVFAIDSIEIN